MDNAAKRCLRDVYRGCRRLGGRVVRDRVDRLSKGLLVADRVRYDDDGESWREYGFRDFGDATDEEIQAYFNRMQVVILSPYDCTGKPFTNWIDYHRNPCGLVSFVHRLSLDV